MIHKVCTLSRKELLLEIRLRTNGKAGEFDLSLETLRGEHMRRIASDIYWRTRNADGSQKNNPPTLGREDWGWIG